MDILTILESGEVQRFHSATGMDNQDLAQHQWQTAMIAIAITKEHLSFTGRECADSDKRQLTTVVDSLTHDCFELSLGDIPSPMKKKYPELISIETRERASWEKEVGMPYFYDDALTQSIRKMADMLSGMYHCMRCRRKGQIGAVQVFYTWERYIQSSDLLETCGEGAKKIHDTILTEMIKAERNTAWA